jgi:hypothetical protein
VGVDEIPRAQQVTLGRNESHLASVWRAAKVIGLWPCAPV